MNDNQRRPCFKRVWVNAPRPVESKRMRSANFSTTEKSILIHLVQTNLKVVESKKTSAVSQEEKNSTWERITAEFAARSPEPKRSASSLRKLWENLKKASRSEVAKQMELMAQSGGGKAMFNINPIFQSVASLIGLNVWNDVTHKNELADFTSFNGESQGLDEIVEVNDDDDGDGNDDDGNDDEHGIDEMMNQGQSTAVHMWKPVTIPQFQTSGESSSFPVLPSYSPSDPHLLILEAKAKAQTSSSTSPSLTLPPNCQPPLPSSIEPSACAVTTSQKSAALQTQQNAESERRPVLTWQRANLRKKYLHRSSPSKPGNRDSLYAERLRMLRREIEFADREEERKEELHSLQMMNLKEEMQWKRELHTEKLREIRLNNRILQQKLRIALDAT